MTTSQVTDTDIRMEDVITIPKLLEEFLRFYASGAPLCGIDIANAIESIDPGRNFRDASLYSTLRRLRLDQLIEPYELTIAESIDTWNAEKRKYYVISEKGARMLSLIRERQRKMDLFFVSAALRTG